MYKSLVVIVDDFSDRVYDLGSNITVFDRGKRDIIKLKTYNLNENDNILNYVNLANPEFLIQDTSFGFESLTNPHNSF